MSRIFWRSGERARLAAGLILLLLCGACAPALPAGPTAAPAATVAAAPTANPAPSATSALTPTAAATASPVPSATAALTPTAATPAVSTLVFTGVIVPARCVQAALDRLGDPGYPYAEVKEIIQSASLAVGVLNAALSDYAPRTGCVSTYVLVGDPDNAPAMAAAGFDVMNVATNHIKNCGLSNCGDRAFFDTLQALQDAGLATVGAGPNLAEAEQPLIVTLNGVRFGFVALGQIEPLAFAGPETPGIAVLTEEALRRAIAAARQSADVVIAMPHWGPEDVPNPNWSQRALARAAVEAGADLVVGNHTHVVQAVQQIEGVTVFYGLGNFVFDQWPRDHQQGVILEVRFEGGRMAGYRLIPTRVDKDGRVHIVDEAEAAEILQRIQAASDKLR